MFPKLSINEVAKLEGITIPGVRHKLKSKNIELKRFGNKLYFDHYDAKKYFNFKFNKKKIAFQMLKGGVGKTTLIQSISLCASLYGARILCIDTDQQSNLTLSFNMLKKSASVPILVDLLRGDGEIQDSLLNVAPGVDLLPSTMDNASLDYVIDENQYPVKEIYSNIIGPVIDNYDLIFIDSGPSLYKPVIAGLLFSDLIVAPITPSDFCVSGLKHLLKELNRLKRAFNTDLKITALMNNFDNKTTKSLSVYQTLIKKYGAILFPSYVRKSQEFENMIDSDGENSTNIFETLKKSSPKDDIDIITKSLLEIKDAASK